jgi:hypothetical protein
LVESTAVTIFALFSIEGAIMSVTEIAPDVYRISTFVPEADLQFNQFLIKDDEPFLFHTGMKGLFPVVRDKVATISTLPRFVGSDSATSRLTNVAR